MIKRKRMRITGHAALISLLLFGAMSGNDAAIKEKIDDITYDKLERFKTDKEFNEWAKDMFHIRTTYQGGGCGGLVLGCGNFMMSEVSDDAGKVNGNGDESITNVQEDGVDEGGIIKVSGEYFIILRRGRLFTVRQETDGEPDLVAIAQTNAYPDGWTNGTWYDEMLIRNDLIVVVGYSYRVSATEISFFRLGRDGSLSHESTHFLQSYDYYSSRNYSSRLIGSKLVFYMPVPVYSGNHFLRESISIPSMKTWRKENKTSDWEPIVKKTEVYKPVQGTMNPMMHTVISCDLDEPEINCTGRAVIGPSSRNFYVTRDWIYLWISPFWRFATEEDGSVTPSYLYRLPLTEGDVGAIKTWGSPVDQFSFKESDDGYINVLVLSQGGGDMMWEPEISSSSDMSLFRAPLDMFSSDIPDSRPGHYTLLPNAGSNYYSFRNRFSGDYLLWGTSSGHWVDDNSHNRVFVTPIVNPENVFEIALNHDVQRIEVLGSGAMVIGESTESSSLPENYEPQRNSPANRSLNFSSLVLDEHEPYLADTYVLPDAIQGESRSHGFFYRQSPDGGGTVGLPVRLSGYEWSHLYYGSAEVRFLKVSADFELNSPGSLVASGDTVENDNCSYSCVDWYGNARPVFYRGRTFALMGYEMVEGKIDDDEVTEIRRLNFLQPDLL